MRERSRKSAFWIKHLKIGLIAQLSVAAAAFWAPAHANDLLVAPTRVEFEGRERSTEVILKNIGNEEATYRISLVLRRMTPDGAIEPLENPTAAEKLAEEMIRYAPRRITLEPDAPQAIRIAVRKPADLPDGEYRAHMLFRAIPDADSPAQETEQGSGLSIRLQPIYGVTIPIIIRQGEIDANAQIVSARRAEQDGNPVIAVDMTRQGLRSSYGDFEVFPAAGGDQLVGGVRGIAVYPELPGRSVYVPLDPAVAATGTPLTLRYYESRGGERVLVEERTVTGS